MASSSTTRTRLHGEEKPNLDEKQGHTVAELTPMLTGEEVLDLAKLVRYVLEHPEQFENKKVAPQAAPATSSTPPKFCKWRWRPKATATAKTSSRHAQRNDKSRNHDRHGPGASARC
jgi:hypothetical protein